LLPEFPELTVYLGVAVPFLLNLVYLGVAVPFLLNLVMVVKCLFVDQAYAS